uniref:Uncharacterized protein n=1 Tax=Trichobilharzia regenti TaxID=157069 RepID=A0AA85KKY2_TRIRE|nr:unnamed protein product [Trichobilharzia regenti]
MTGKTIEFLESIRSSMPPTSLLVACVGDSKTAVIFLSVTTGRPGILQKNALVACLEELEMCGVNVAYIAVSKCQCSEQSAVTPLLKTLMFIGFEILNKVPFSLIDLSSDYRLLFTNLHE